MVEEGSTAGAHDELDEIGLTDAALDGAVLIEWPERAGDRLPSPRLAIALARLK